MENLGMELLYDGLDAAADRGDVEDVLWYRKAMYVVAAKKCVLMVFCRKHDGEDPNY